MVRGDDHARSVAGGSIEQVFEAQGRHELVDTPRRVSESERQLDVPATLSSSSSPRCCGMSHTSPECAQRLRLAEDRGVRPILSGSRRTVAP